MAQLLEQQAGRGRLIECEDAGDTRNGALALFPLQEPFQDRQVARRTARRETSSCVASSPLNNGSGAMSSPASPIVRCSADTAPVTRCSSTAFN